MHVLQHVCAPKGLNMCWGVGRRNGLKGCMREVHLLDEDLSQARLAEGVVLQVEAVEAVECVLVSMHVQRVHVKVIPAHHRSLPQQ